MLQQTRVAAVLGYYARFLEAFPSVEALAQAPEEQLMKLWEGLGYYSRARNLQKAARLVAQQGGFPQSYEGLLALPGIGEYTAGAIASAAFGLRVPAVDGNVLRVVSRLTDSREDIALPKTKRTIRAVLETVMPREAEQIRIFNQSTMELGATVCVPNGPPRCEACPAASFCLGRMRGTAPSLPVKSGKKERRREEKTVFLLVREGRLALRRRPDTGPLGRPLGVSQCRGRAGGGVRSGGGGGLGPDAAGMAAKLTARHIFTHVEWEMTGYVLQVRGPGPADFTWGRCKRHFQPGRCLRHLPGTVPKAERILQQEA